MTKNALHIYTDEELMNLLRSGNVNAFDELYLRYAKRLKHYFFRMLDNNAELADDFLQEVMLKLCKDHTKFNSTYNFKTWLFSIAHNLCKNHYRHLNVIEKHRQSIPGEQAQAMPIETIAAIDQLFLQKTLNTALQHLSYEKREVVLLRFQEEKSILEIAEITGLPEGTIKSRLHYALQQLAQLLEHHRSEIF